MSRSYRERLILLFVIGRPLASYPGGLIFFGVGFVFGGAQFTLSVFLALLLLLLAPIVVFGLNDVYDFETDRKSKRKQSLLEGYTLRKSDQTFVLRSCLVISFILVVSGLYYGFDYFLVMVGVVLLSYAYSVPPLRLKTIPVIDSLSNAAGVVLLMALGFTLAAPLEEFPVKLLIASLAAAGAHALGAAADIVPDRAAHVRTVATALGVRGTALMTLLFFLAVIFFSGIQSAAVNVLFWLFVVLCVTIIVVPSPRLTHRLLLGGFYASIVLFAVFFLQTFL